MPGPGPPGPATRRAFYCRRLDDRSFPPGSTGRAAGSRGRAVSEAPGGYSLSFPSADRAASRRRSSTRSYCVSARVASQPKSTPTSRGSDGATSTRARQSASFPRIPSASVSSASKVPRLPGDVTAELQASDLGADPRRRVLQDSGLSAHALRDGRQGRAVRLDVGEDLCRELAQGLAGVLIAEQLQEVDRRRRARQVIAKIRGQGIAAHPSVLSLGRRAPGPDRRLQERDRSETDTVTRPRRPVAVTWRQARPR